MFNSWTLLVATLRNATPPTKSLRPMLSQVPVHLPAGNARPALEVQLLVSLGAQDFTKISFVPLIRLVTLVQLAARTTRRLGVHRPAKLTILRPLPSMTRWSRSNDPLATLPWGSWLSRLWTVRTTGLMTSLDVAISTVRSLILRLVRERKLVVTKVGPVDLLVTILILEGLVGTLTVILPRSINRPVVAIHRPLGLNTPQIPGIDLALQVTVVTVRTFFVPNTPSMFVALVVNRTVGRIPLLPFGGA